MPFTSIDELTKHADYKKKLKTELGRVGSKPTKFQFIEGVKSDDGKKRPILLVGKVDSKLAEAIKKEGGVVKAKGKCRHADDELEFQVDTGTLKETTLKIALGEASLTRPVKQVADLEDEDEEGEGDESGKKTGDGKAQHPEPKAVAAKSLEDQANDQAKAIAGPLYKELAPRLKEMMPKALPGDAKAMADAHKAYISESSDGHHVAALESLRTLQRALGAAERGVGDNNAAKAECEKLEPALREKTKTLSSKNQERLGVIWKAYDSLRNSGDYSKARTKLGDLEKVLAKVASESKPLGGLDDEVAVDPGFFTTRNDAEQAAKPLKDRSDKAALEGPKHKDTLAAAWSQYDKHFAAGEYREAVDALTETETAVERVEKINAEDRERYDKRIVETDTLVDQSKNMVTAEHKKTLAGLKKEAQEARGKNDLDGALAKLDEIDIKVKEFKEVVAKNLETVKKSCVKILAEYDQLTGRTQAVIDARTELVAAQDAAETTPEIANFRRLAQAVEPLKKLVAEQVKRNTRLAELKRKSQDLAGRKLAPLKAFEDFDLDEQLAEVIEPFTSAVGALKDDGIDEEGYKKLDALYLDCESWIGTTEILRESVLTGVVWEDVEEKRGEPGYAEVDKACSRLATALNSINPKTKDFVQKLVQNLNVIVYSPPQEEDGEQIVIDSKGATYKSKLYKDVGIPNVYFRLDEGVVSGQVLNAFQDALTAGVIKAKGTGVSGIKIKQGGYELKVRRDRLEALQVSGVLRLGGTIVKSEGVVKIVAFDYSYEGH